MTLKHLHVTCAIIEQNGHVLVAQRSESMSLPLKWEFPGGKIHEGETLEECLVREIKEELNLTIGIKKILNPYTHSYPNFMITLYPYVCSIECGTLVLAEHSKVKWLTPEKLPKLDWADADIPVLANYMENHK